MDLLPVGLAPKGFNARKAPTGLCFLCYHFTLFFQTAISERAVSFIDGQNLFRHAKDAFGHHHPNYDLHKLTNAVCVANGWSNHGIWFYTDNPSVKHSPMWHDYWARRRTAIRFAALAQGLIFLLTARIALAGIDRPVMHCVLEQGVDGPSLTHQEFAFGTNLIHTSSQLCFPKIDSGDPIGKFAGIGKPRLTCE